MAESRLDLEPITEKINEAQYILHHALTVLARKGDLLSKKVKISSGCVLDHETGSGIWTIELAKLCKTVNFVATGFRGSPSWVPGNVKISENWPSAGPFDVVHKRFLFSKKFDWELLFESIKPDGHIEVEIVDWRPYDSCGNLLQGSCLYEWAQMMQRDFQDIKPKLKEAGFINVAEESIELPIGSWTMGTMRLGAFFSLALLEILKSSTESNERATDIVKQCIEETQDPDMHAHCKYLVVTGLRPSEL